MGIGAWKMNESSKSERKSNRMLLFFSINPKYVKKKKIQDWIKSLKFLWTCVRWNSCTCSVWQQKQHELLWQNKSDLWEAHAAIFGMRDVYSTFFAKISHKNCKCGSNPSCSVWLKPECGWMIIRDHSRPTAAHLHHTQTLSDLFTRSSADVLKYNLHLTVSDPMSCFSTMQLQQGSEDHPSTPESKHEPTGSGLDPLSFPFALVNTIIAVLCSCGLHVNTVAVKGHHAPSKDDGSLKWALSVAAIFHSTGPTHEGGLVAPSSWATLVTGGGEKEMNGLTAIYMHQEVCLVQPPPPTQNIPSLPSLW